MHKIFFEDHSVSFKFCYDFCRRLEFFLQNKILQLPDTSLLFFNERAIGYLLYEFWKICEILSWSILIDKSLTFRSYSKTQEFGSISFERHWSGLVIAGRRNKYIFKEIISSMIEMANDQRSSSRSGSLLLISFCSFSKYFKSFLNRDWNFRVLTILRILLSHNRYWRILKAAWYY
jgi:hypothetical protein